MALEAGATSGTRLLFAPREPPLPAPDVAHELGRYRAWRAEREQERLRGHEPVAPRQRVSVLVLSSARPLDASFGTLRAIGGQTVMELEVCVGLQRRLFSAPLEAIVSLLGTMVLWVRMRRRLRLKAVRIPPGCHPADEAAALLERATGEAVLLVDSGDELAPDAVTLLLNALESSSADVAYGDEDWVGQGGLYENPILKPEWSPELLLATPYLGRPVLIRRSALDRCGGIRQSPGDWEHDVHLRLAEQLPVVAHVPEVLCHRSEAIRRNWDPTPVTQALARRSEAGSVAPRPDGTGYSISRRPHRPTSVGIVIPYKDAPELLRACTDSLFETVDPDRIDHQLILVDNGSTDPETLTLAERLAMRPNVAVISDGRPFNWAALSNHGARSCDTEVLLFLNNDIEARRSGWLEPLLAQALRPRIGAAGGRLLYPSGHVQHVGMVLGLGGAAGHVLAGLPGSDPGYLGMAVLSRECSAVTGACLATRREVFEELEGFDEALGVDLNDVDYCLRAGVRGYSVVFEPGAELIHHESPSRGTSGSTKDIRQFLDRWEQRVMAGDPFLNAHLTRLDSSCALRKSGEADGWQRWRSNLQT